MEIPEKSQEIILKNKSIFDLALTEMAQGNSKINMIHNGKPDKIIESACKTVGVSFDYIFKIFSERTKDFDNFQSIDVGSWCYFCTLFNLDIGCISYGYSPLLHRKSIGEAIYRGNYHLPITPEVKEIWKIFKIEIKNQRKDEF